MSVVVLRVILCGPHQVTAPSSAQNLKVRLSKWESCGCVSECIKWIMQTVTNGFIFFFSVLFLLSLFPLLLFVFVFVVCLFFKRVSHYIALPEL